jgi:hypothetical protein
MQLVSSVYDTPTSTKPVNEKYIGVDSRVSFITFLLKVCLIVSLISFSVLNMQNIRRNYSIQWLYSPNRALASSFEVY